MKALQRDIQRAKSRGREYDHYLRELNELKQDQLEELKKLTEAKKK